MTGLRTEEASDRKPLDGETSDGVGDMALEDQGAANEVSGDLMM